MEDFEDKSLDEAEEEELTSPEEAFMQGFLDPETEECAECGQSVKEIKSIKKEFPEGEFLFCSKSCASDFEDGL